MSENHLQEYKEYYAVRTKRYADNPNNLIQDIEELIEHITNIKSNN